MEITANYGKVLGADRANTEGITVDDQAAETEVVSYFLRGLFLCYVLFARRALFAVGKRTRETHTMCEFHFNFSMC